MIKISEEANLLRVFMSEKDNYKGKPLYEQIIINARNLKLSGATVIRGIVGFGAESHLHTAKLLELSEDLPIIVEIVDKEENIEKLIPFIEETLKDGLVTIEKVRVIRYNKG